MFVFRIIAAATAPMEHSRRFADGDRINDEMLPSYQDAIKRPDWLGLVAAYVPIGNYARLCLVSKRFYDQFAPRLWNDPLAVMCMLNREYG